MTNRLTRFALTCVLAGAAMSPAAAADRPHNVVLFIPDGLRAPDRRPEDRADHGGAARRRACRQEQPLAVPDLHDRNASRMATGHYLGDTGDFSNIIYVGFPVSAANGTVTPFIENDPVLGELDAHFKGNYLDEVTLSSKRHGRRATRSAPQRFGKLGPTLIFDHANRSGEPTIVVDDSTGSPNGIPLSKPVIDALSAAGLPLAAPSRWRQRQGSATRRRRARRSPMSTSSAIFVDVATQGRAADVQGAQPAVPAGVLVARPGRQPAQSG